MGLSVGLAFISLSLLWQISSLDWQQESEDSQIRQFFEKINPQGTISPELKEKLRKHIKLTGTASLTKFEECEELL